MKFISDREIRNQPGKIREELKSGEVILTSRGKPYALMLPVDPDRLEDMLVLTARLRALQAVARIRARAAQTGLDHVTDEEVDAEIAASRKRASRNTLSS